MWILVWSNGWNTVEKNIVNCVNTDLLLRQVSIDSIIISIVYRLEMLNGKDVILEKVKPI
jgi:hypothetical protein